MLVLYSSSGGLGKVDDGCLCWCCIVLMVDKEGWIGGCLCWCCIVLVVDKVRLGWWMLMLELYSSSGIQGKVGMVDAYVGAQ